MSVGFSQIPQNLRVPFFYMEFNNSLAGQSQSSYPALLIGQSLISQPLAPQLISGADDAAAAFGAGSMLARMVAAYRNNDAMGELWVLPLADNPAASAATGTLVLSGTAAAAGTLPLYIADQSVPVAVNQGDPAAAVAANVVASVNAMATLPVTATSVNGTVTLTSRWKGATANAITINLAVAGAQGGESIPAGLVAAITAMTGGVTDPDLSVVAAAIGDEPYDYIGTAYTQTNQLNQLQSLMNNVAGRWSYMSQIYGGVFCARAAAGNTVSAMVQDAVAFGTSRNDPHAVVVNYENPSPSVPWETAAMWTAQAAVALNADPARPLQTLPLVGFTPPPVGHRFKLGDQQTLLTSGVALMAYDRAGNASILRAVTTYQQNAFGAPDQSYLDCETPFTLMAVARFFRNRITQKFPRAKLVQDGTKFGAGQPIVTPKSVRAEIIAAYADMVTLGWVQDIAGFKAALIVEINALNPTRLDVGFNPTLVGGLRDFAVLNSFILNAPQSA